MEKNFEAEVLTRLAVIESKLDEYKSFKEKSDVAYNLSRENKQEIEELKEKIKWITRTIAGAIVSGTIGIIFILVQMGIGLK